MKIKAKHIIMLGAFIVLTLIGYQLLPKEEVLIQTSTMIANSNLSGEIEEMIYVHIEGAIYFPGIKEVPKGTRLFELIEIAGGETEEADISKVNLASVLKDEQKVYIPFLAKEKEITNDEMSQLLLEKNENTLNYFENRYININEASLEELQTLDGIGPSMAQKIISYREENGYFTSIEEIQQVNGIGNAKYEKIKDHITI